MRCACSQWADNQDIKVASSMERLAQRVPEACIQVYKP